MSREVSNSDDIIDSRDVIARIEELEAERDACDADAYEEWQESAEADELAALCNLRDEAEGCDDWAHGASLIRDSYFEEYAEQLADDIGAIDQRASWPLTCIDWEKAARELQMDYTSVEFDGVTYWMRC